MNIYGLYINVFAWHTLEYFSFFSLVVSGRGYLLEGCSSTTLRVRLMISDLSPIMNHQVHFSDPSRRFNTNTFIKNPFRFRQKTNHSINNGSDSYNMTHIRDCYRLTMSFRWFLLCLQNRRITGLWNPKSGPTSLYSSPSSCSPRSDSSGASLRSNKSIWRTSSSDIGNYPVSPLVWFSELRYYFINGRVVKNT